eukprot:gene12622-16925_t
MRISIFTIVIHIVFVDVCSSYWHLQRPQLPITIKNKLIKHSCSINDASNQRKIKEIDEISNFNNIIQNIEINAELYPNSSNPGYTNSSDSINEKENIFSNGFFLLNFVAILWGTQHVVIKSSLDDYSTSSLLNFWRFTLSSLLFLPSFIAVLKEKKVDTMKAGMELGLYTFLGFGFQAIGLETTTASRSAFLLYLNVKIVPFLAAIFLKRSISLSTWISAALALTGTYLLSTDGGPMNPGDLWCICAAFASALFILRLEKFSISYGAADLNAVSFTTGSVAILCSFWLSGDIYFGNFHSLLESNTQYDINNGNNFFDKMTILLPTIIQEFTNNPWPVLYLGVITTGLCNYLQTIGQRKVSAEKAAIIYSIDPVYGAFFSKIFLGEEFGLQSVFGSFLIMFGIWFSSKDNSSSLDVTRDELMS